MQPDKKYTILQNLAYCIRTTGQTYPILLVLCFFMIAVNCVIPVISAFLPKVVIEKITEGTPLGHLLLITAGFTLALAVLMGAQEYLDRQVYWHRFKMNTFFLRKITKKGLTTDYCNQEKEHFRKLQSESFASCNGNYSYYAQTYDAIVLFFSNLLGFLAFMGILVTLDPLLILFLCATTLINFLLNRRILKWMDSNNEEKLGYGQRMMYIVNASEDTQAAKDIRLYNMSVWMNRIYQENMQGLLGWYRKYTAKLFRVSAVDSSLTFFREGATYLVLLYMVSQNRITVAEFVLYFNVVAGFSVWLDSMLGQINNLKRLSMAMNRFRTYLEYPEQYKRDEGLPVTKRDVPGKLTLENVSFRYSEESEDILKNINLEIEPGEHLAVVGLNGAGKTTFIKLLCRLYDPTEGEILLNGIDIRKYDYEEYMQLFAFVFQDFKLFSFSLGQNIAASRTYDSDKIEECMKKVSFYDRYKSMPDGLETYLYKDLSRNGVEISGGEAQKIALARALYKETPVIVLDEPTAALDPIAEAQVYADFSNMVDNKTAIYISHRLSSCQFCDEITVFEGGRIVQKGTHAQLASQTTGKYFELWNAQAKYYQNPAAGV